MILQAIPPGQYKYEEVPVFVSYPKGSGPWHILGPAELIVTGKIVQVHNHSQGSDCPVEVLDLVAERTVRRHDGSRTRYVIASFDRIVQPWKTYPVLKEGE